MTQNIVEITKVHGYKCPQCEWWFDTDEGAGRDNPMTGVFFDVEQYWRDENNDIFIKDGPKILKGTEMVTCHRPVDDSDYVWCAIDMDTFVVTECHGWKCEGCGAECWYDNDNCARHTYSASEEASKLAKKAVESSCSCAKGEGAAPAPVGAIEIGDQVRVKVERPLSADLHPGNMVKVRDVRVNGRLSVEDERGNGWTVDVSHVEVVPAPVPQVVIDYPVGCKVKVTREGASGARVDKDEVVEVVGHHENTEWLIIQKEGGQRWNLETNYAEIVPDIPEDLADKFRPKTGEKKTTYIDF